MVHNPIYLSQKFGSHRGLLHYDMVAGITRTK